MNEVYEVLKKYGKPLTVKEVTKNLDHSLSTVRCNLRNLSLKYPTDVEVRNNGFQRGKTYCIRKNRKPS